MKIERLVLKKALEHVKPGLVNDNIIDQTDSFIFKNNFVYTYNEDCFFRHPIELDFEGSIKAEEFYKYISTIKQEKIEIEIKDNQFLVKTRKSKASFLLQHDIQLPINTIQEVREWCDVGAEFADQLKLATDCCSHDLSNGLLNCVHLTPKYIEAGDIYQFVKQSTELELKENILLPVDSVKEIIKIKPTAFSIVDSYIYFTDGDLICGCKRVEENYPNTDKAYKCDESIEGILPDNIDELIEKAEIFAKRDTSMDEDVNVCFENSFFWIRATSQNGSKFEEKTRLVDDIEKDISFSISVSLLRNLSKKTNHFSIGSNRVLFETESMTYVAIITI